MQRRRKGRNTRINKNEKHEKDQDDEKEERTNTQRKTNVKLLEPTGFARSTGTGNPFPIKYSDTKNISIKAATNTTTRLRGSKQQFCHDQKPAYSRLLGMAVTSLEGSSP